MHFLLLLSFFNLFTLWGQTVISGRVIDAVSQEVLVYVNIGIRGQNIGCVSKEKGEFYIDIPTSNLSDTITFSYVGYQEKSYPIQALVKQKEVVVGLQPKKVSLPELVVNGKIKWKVEKLGTSTYSGFEVAYAGESIEEVGQKIELGSDPVKISSYHIFLARVYSSQYTFRINFYGFNGETIGDKIYQKEILLTQSLKRGWLNVDLEALNIWLSGTVLVAIEFLPASNLKQDKISPIYGAAMFGKRRSFARMNSLASWAFSESKHSIYLTVKKKR